MDGRLELAVLGYAASSYELLDECISDHGLTIDHFPHYPNLWRVLQSLHRKGSLGIGEASIRAEATLLGLDLPDELPAAGDSLCVSQLLEVFRKKTLRAGMIALLSRLDAGENISESDLAVTLESTGGAQLLTGGARLIGDILADSCQFLCNRALKSTGFRSLDRLMNGWSAGQLYILGGRPGMGKTAIALNLCRHLPSPVAFYSLEMTSSELVARLLSMESRIPLWKIRSPNHNTDFSLLDARDSLSSRALYINDSGAQTIHSLRTECRRMARKLGSLGSIVIDYLQLLRASDPRLPREQQIAEMSRSLKALSKELAVPILCLCQINRSAEQENRTPRLSDLRESGSIEQDADVVMFIDRREEFRSVAEEDVKVPRSLVVAKNRHGACGSIPLWFARDVQLFLEEES